MTVPRRSAPYVTPTTCTSPPQPPACTNRFAITSPPVRTSPSAGPKRRGPSRAAIANVTATVPKSEPTRSCLPPRTSAIGLKTSFPSA